MPFEYSHRVTYSDCTLGNHVYYARYLELLESARNELFRDLGATFLYWQERDIIFPVVEAHLKYRGPARYDDVLRISVWVTTAHRARLNFAYRVNTHDGVAVLEGETFHVCTGLDEKPKRLPEDLIERLRPHLLTSPGETRSETNL